MKFTLPIVFSIVLAPLASAQVDTGTLSGVVRDTTGAVIQKASVRILSPSTGISLSLSTNSEGLYSSPGLRPGEYQLSASALGFQTVTKSGIQLRVQDRLGIDFELQPGQTSTAVTVEATAPLLESETSSLGHVVEEREINDLPLNGRNYIQLATLGAGTSPSRRGAERNTFIANGARELQNTYLLDGIDNKNKIVGFDSSAAQAIEPVLDGVEEFKVQTSTFSAEFGQAAGAVVNVTLKSGTNNLHGSLFDYSRNSFFDATPFFQVIGQKPNFNQNQFGGTVGGPVIKDKTFFFFSWQSLRTSNVAPQLATVPTLNQRQGIFTTPLYDPATTTLAPDGVTYTRSPFPGNTVPSARWDPVSAKLLQLYPLPNLTSASNFISDQRETIANDQFNIRGDHHFGSKDTFFARYSASNTSNVLPAPVPPPASNASTVTPEAHSIVGSETHILRADLINEARIGYMETREQQQVPGTNLDAQYGITGVPDYPEVHGLPTFGITGLNTLGTTGPGTLPIGATGSGNLPLDKQGRNIQILDNLSWIKGRHTFKFGVDIEQVTLYAYVTLSARPAIDFTGVYTQNPQSHNGTGSPFADFLLGWVNDFTESTRPHNESRQHTFETYIQDDWKAMSKLTLNLGLRYELAMPWYETTGRYANFILDPGNAAYGQVITAAQASKYGYRDSFSNPQKTNFAARVGLAYQLTPKTVIRSGFGVFFGRADENLGISSRPTNNVPFFERSVNTGDQVHPLILLSQGLPPNALDPNNVLNQNANSWPTHMPLPYIYQWNFNVQRELGHSFTTQIGYVSSSGHDLYVDPNINQPPPGPGAVGPRRPFPTYSSVLAFLPLVRSNYQSLIFELQRRFHNGFSLLGAYTWSHSIDNGGQTSDSGDVGPQNPLNLAAERGSSNFDVRQRVSVSYIYELPFGKGKPFLNRSGWARAIADGWQLSGVTSVQTGLPFTPVLSSDPTNTGATVRPNAIVGASLYPAQQSNNNWYNAAAFVTPAAYKFGNAGRDILRGPSTRNNDVGLERTVAIRERFSLRFRAEAFNLFNTPQFGLPNNKLGVATTGVITTVVTPERQFQLGLRLGF